jgi:hypothetical protein
MNLPFTIDQFLDVFRRYNETVWPAQFALNVLAIMVVVAAVRGGRTASRLASAVLGALWMWMGLVYHFGFFRAINPAASLFGVAFLVEGILIVWLGVVRPTLRFDGQLESRGLVAGVLLAYALIAYPALGYLLGHGYPLAPTFGVPCPTTIFTFGILLLSARPRSRTVIVIPTAWAFLGMFAALRLGMWEDLGLVVAAVVAATIVMLQRNAAPKSAARPVSVAAAHR